MRGCARRLEGKHEIIRRFAGPFAKALPRLRTIEGAIDLDRGQPAACVFQLARLRQAARIELAAPWLEYPAADTDTDHRCVLPSPERFRWTDRRGARSAMPRQ